LNVLSQVSGISQDDRSIQISVREFWKELVNKIENLVLKHQIPEENAKLQSYLNELNPLIDDFENKLIKIGKKRERKRIKEK